MLMSPTSTVVGVVTEEDGEPVVGASVLVKGTTLGTITDIDGRFTIQHVHSTAKTLKISFIGMETKDVDIKSGTINVVLKSDSEMLDEVMVVAYGTAKKASFTGSASVVKAGEISAQTESLVKSLQGQVAGVRIGGSTGELGADKKMLVRGIVSIHGSTQHLELLEG